MVVDGRKWWLVVGVLGKRHINPLYLFTMEDQESISESILFFVPPFSSLLNTILLKVDHIN